MSVLLDRYEEILERLGAELVAHYGPRLVSVAVFGSVGRGTPRQDSDIDGLIVARGLPRGRTARVEEFLPVDARVESTPMSCASPLKGKSPGLGVDFSQWLTWRERWPAVPVGTVA